MISTNIRLGKYNPLIFIFILLLIGAFSVALWGIVSYPWQGSPEVTIPDPAPFKSIIPSTQSGITEFSIPLPPSGWELPVNVLCTLHNLTNAGIYQNVPVNINIKLTLQNAAAIGTVADKYIFIHWFDVKPINAIEVSYLPTARFSTLWCTTHAREPRNLSNTEYETFSDSGRVILQDTGLLDVEIDPFITVKNPVDPIWQESNLTYYLDFKLIVSIPVPILSEFEASREVLQEQQQNLQYEFDKLRAQHAVDQETESNRGFSLALFVFAFALIDIAVALYSFCNGEDKKRKTNDKQRKILEYLERNEALR